MKKYKHRTSKWIVVLVILALVVGVTTLLRQSPIGITEMADSNQEYTDSDSLYFNQLEDKCAEMTIEQRQEFKKYCESALERLNYDITSDSINPEEQHNKILSRQFIERELELVKKYLQQ